MNTDQAIRWKEEGRLADYLHHHYELKLKKIKSIRGVLRLETNMGVYVLKKVASKETARWKMIAELAQHLKNRFLVPSPIPTKSGKLVFNGFHDKYVLLPWIDANPIVIKKKQDWERVTSELATLHKESKGFPPTPASRKFRKVGKWLAEWRHAYRQLELFQVAATWTSKPTQTDESWLEVASYSLGMMENLLKYFEKIKGDQCCLETEKFGKICHGNLHRHNLLIDDYEQLYFIDWNQAVFDVRSRDLSQWLIYAYHQTGDPAVIKVILQSYQRMEKLSEEEYALIYARFLYPERLVRVLRDIYEDQTLPITAGAPSVAIASKVEEQKLTLLKMFPQLVNDYFNVQIPQIEWLNR